MGVALPDPAARTWKEILSPASRLQIVMLAILLFLAYRVTIIDRLVHQWWNDPNWGHGWLVPLLSLYMISTQRERLAGARRTTSLAGLGLLVGSLGLYLWTLLVRPQVYVQGGSIVLTLLGIVLYLGGWQIFRSAWFPVAFLGFAVPLPGALYERVTWPMRKLASDLSAGLLSLIPDLDAERSGVTIDYVYQGEVGPPLNVEEACSGMRLMMAFVALGLMMAYLGRRPLWQRVVLVLFCVPIALMCNVLRVTLTGCIHVFKIESLASDVAHELLGIAMLPVAIGMFLVVGYVLKNLVVETPDPRPER